MTEWIKIDNNNIKENEFIINPNNINPIFYKLHKGDIIPVTLKQAIAQTDIIFNKGLFKVNKICKYSNNEAVFYVEYMKGE